MIVAQVNMAELCYIACHTGFSSPPRTGVFSQLLFALSRPLNHQGETIALVLILFLSLSLLVIEYRELVSM